MEQTMIELQNNTDYRYQKLNTYTFEDGYVVINIESPKHGPKYAFIDSEDFERVSSFTWSFMLNNSGEELIFTNIHHPQVGKQIMYLHRFITDAQPGCEVDHIDNNGLNNMKLNLRTSVVPHVAKLMNAQNKLYRGKIAGIRKTEKGFKVKDLQRPFKFLMNAFIALEKNRSEQLQGYIPLPLWRIEELCIASNLSI